jgi:K+-transporting ATPase ATPase A chain
MGTVLIQLALFLAILTIMALALGEYMAKVFKGEKTLFSFILSPIEQLLYTLFNVDKTTEMDWKTYSSSLIYLSVLGVIGLFLLQTFQHLLPLNPEGLGAVRWDTALNTAVSFVTNTNWQAYAGESTLSYLTQMLGLTVQNFLSAAMGIAVAFIRAFTKKETATIGNFWVDLTRSIVYILLPLSVVYSIIFVSQGSIQNFNPYTKAHTVQGQEQLIAQGPVASQESIKMLGTNGGGFFNANSAHPYENPTPPSPIICRF